MANPIIREMFRQNLWANLTILDALEPLGEQTKTMEMVGGYSNAYDTMVHVIGSETSYLARIPQANATIPWERGEQPDWNRLREVSNQTGEAFMRLADHLDGDPIARGVYRDEPFTMPVSLLLIQAYNHGVDHRSQVKSILTQHGLEPPELDGWWWSESGS